MSASGWTGKFRPALAWSSISTSPAALSPRAASMNWWRARTAASFLISTTPWWPIAKRRPAAKSVAASVAPKLVLASAPVTLATTTTTAAAPIPAPAENAQKPADFAFVEPKYSVKENNQDNKAAQPAAKAQEAAGGFADKRSEEH